MIASTEVDKTGASYYGEQTLHYLATNGESAVVQLRKSVSFYYFYYYYLSFENFQHVQLIMLTLGLISILVSPLSSKEWPDLRCSLESQLKRVLCCLWLHACQGNSVQPQV